MRILLVEDEPKLANLIKKGIEKEAFEVDIALDGKEGQTMFMKAPYDIVILDVNLPFISGLELCRIIKKPYPETSILMLTALDSIDDKISGFEMGADDYLLKPFELRELLARIRALSKRRKVSVVSDNGILKYADLELNIITRTAIRNGKVIPLTARECTLLEYMMRNKGMLVTKEEIFEKVWNFNFNTQTNIIEVYLFYLRRKIDKEFEKKLIHNVHGMGYIFKEM